MTDALTRLAVWLNALANAVGGWVLAPVGVLPGWLSATAVAAGSGLVLLVVFKHTSNQRAIKRVRDDVSAHLLALKLFKDNAGVAVRAQGRILWGAARLFVLSLVPMSVMALPVTLALGQLALWYQQRPLAVGEEAVVVVRLAGDTDAAFPEVSLRPTDAVEAAVGPVRVVSEREVCWNVRACVPGRHRLTFQVGDQAIDKELAIGDGFMRVSARRPGWQWTEVLMDPAEEPLGPNSPVRSVEIDYPRRASWTSGSDAWVIYWFAASTVAALCFRGLLGVQV